MPKVASDMVRGLRWYMHALAYLAAPTIARCRYHTPIRTFTLLFHRGIPFTGGRPLGWQRGTEMLEKR